MAASPITVSETNDPLNSDISSLFDSELPVLTITQQAEVIKQCSNDIHALLDLEEIFPYLYQNNLLTDSETDSLQSTNVQWSRKQKISMLVTSLPRKGFNVLSRFHDCLVHSANGTAHLELADMLCSKAKEICNSSTPGCKYGRRIPVKTIASTLLCVAAVIICIAVWSYYPQIKHQFKLLDSKTLPYRSEEIVGREEEIREVLGLIDFGSSETRIINIVGSPGFGKSTLAIHIGHKMVEKGVIVHYVNMAEISDKQLQQALAEKLLESANILSKDITFSRLLKWAHDTHAYNLLIFDNCDDSLNYQKEALQEAVDKVVESSNRVKILMTSREITMHLQYFHQYKLYELSTKASCDLLQYKVSHKVNISVNEIEILAELSGNVPLALQIVGSLLLLPDPPTPEVIIKELKEQPISTLSPEQLPKTQQINASLSLSYKYLAQEVRFAGQFLAHFPGSFQAQAASKIFEGVGLSTEWQIDMYRSMQALVQRSLLVHNQRTDRYSFHRLIREYFLDVHRHEKPFKNESFALEFNHYYSNILMKLTHMFSNNNYMKALRTLDVEKHNFQWMFENMKLPERPSVDFESIKHVVEAIGAGLLKCRFANKEIAELLRNAIAYVKTDYLASNTPIELKTTQLQVYYSLIVQLANMERELHGTATAIQVYLQHETVFISDKHSLPTESGLYISFYSNLAKYHFALGQYQEGLKCHAKILNKEHTEEHLLNCINGHDCKFFDIGMLYYQLGHSQEALELLQRSLHNEELDVLKRAEIALLMLEVKADLERKFNVQQNTTSDSGRNYFETVLAGLNQIPSITLYQDCSRTLNVIYLLRRGKYDEEAINLEEKLLQVIKDIDISPEKAIPWQTSFEVAMHLYSQSRYDKVVELGTFLLQSIEQVEHTQQISHELKPKLQMVVARSKFHAGNYSSGLDIMEAVVDQQLARGLYRMSHREEFDTACTYLLVRVKYINKCYSVTKRIASNALKFGFFVIYITIVPPLNIYPTHANQMQPEALIPQPQSSHPELTYITLSSKRSLETQNKDITQATDYLSEFWVIFRHLWAKINPKLYFTKVFNTVLKTIASSPAVRILFNVSFTWVRLCMLFSFCQFLHQMSRRITVTGFLGVFLGIAFTMMSSDKTLVTFTLVFWGVIGILTLLLLVKRHGMCVIYWTFLIFILAVVVICGKKGDTKEIFRTARDPRSMAEFYC